MLHSKSMTNTPALGKDHCLMPAKTNFIEPARRLSFVSATLAARPYLRQAKSLVLVIMMALVLGVAGVARAQQEVAPEHFDNPAQYAPVSKATRARPRRMTKIGGHRSPLMARAHRAGQGTGRKSGLHSAS